MQVFHFNGTILKGNDAKGIYQDNGLLPRELRIFILYVLCIPLPFPEGAFFTVLLCQCTHIKNRWVSTF